MFTHKSELYYIMTQGPKKWKEGTNLKLNEASQVYAKAK